MAQGHRPHKSLGRSPQPSDHSGVFLWPMGPTVSHVSPLAPASHLPPFHLSLHCPSWNLEISPYTMPSSPGHTPSLFPVPPGETHTSCHGNQGLAIPRSLVSHCPVPAEPRAPSPILPGTSTPRTLGCCPGGHSLTCPLSSPALVLSPTEPFPPSPPGLSRLPLDPGANERTIQEH